MGIFEDSVKGDYFIASVLLNSSCEHLGKDLSSLNARQLENLSWVSELMREVNWEKPGRDKGEPEMIVLATQIRPLFYETAISQFPDYNQIDFQGVLDRKNTNETDIARVKSFLDTLSKRCLAECRRGDYGCC